MDTVGTAEASTRNQNSRENHTDVAPRPYLPVIAEAQFRKNLTSRLLPVNAIGPTHASEQPPTTPEPSNPALHTRSSSTATIRANRRSPWVRRTMTTPCPPSADRSDPGSTCRPDPWPTPLRSAAPFARPATQPWPEERSTWLWPRGSGMRRRRWEPGCHRRRRIRVSGSQQRVRQPSRDRIADGRQGPRRFASGGSRPGWR